MNSHFLPPQPYPKSFDYSFNPGSRSPFPYMGPTGYTAPRGHARRYLPVPYVNPRTIVPGGDRFFVGTVGSLMRGAVGVTSGLLAISQAGKTVDALKNREYSSALMHGALSGVAAATAYQVTARNGIMYDMLRKSGAAATSRLGLGRTIARQVRI